MSIILAYILGEQIIKYHKKAVKFINSLPPKERQRIKLLPEEKKELEEAMADLKNDINISDGSDIQW